VYPITTEDLAHVSATYTISAPNGAAKMRVMRILIKPEAGNYDMIRKVDIILFGR